MRRRDIIRAGLAAGALGVPGSGIVGATGDGRTGTASGGSDLSPAGHVPVANAYEVVVDDGGNHAYVAAKTGFAVVDVSNPAAPRVVAERRNLQASHPRGPLKGLIDCKVDGDTLIVVGSGLPEKSPNQLHGVLVYDVSDPASPRLRTFYETDWGIHNCYLQDGLAYLPATDPPRMPFKIVDVTGSTVTEVGEWVMIDSFPQYESVNATLRGMHDLVVRDGIAYCANWDAGTWILDVSDPSDPSAITRIGGAPVAELSDLPAAEVKRRNMEPPGNSHYVTVNDDASLLFVGRETFDTNPDDATGGPSGIDIYDLASESGPSRVSTIHPPHLSGGGGTHADAPDTHHSGPGGTARTAHNFDVSGDYLYSSWYHGGVRVHDVSDPENPEEIAHWSNPPDGNFWTARLAREGECFVGGNLGKWSDENSGGVYVFPDPRSGSGGGGGGGGDDDGGSGPARAWTFETDGDREGWTSVNVVDAPGQPSDGRWLGRAEADPHWDSPDLDLPASAASTVRFRMANQNPKLFSKGVVFFRTASADSYSIDRAVAFDTHEDGAWRDYAVDVGSHSAWNGTITGIRIDPVETSGGKQIGLDHVRLE